MKYRPYPHEALKKAIAGALGPAKMDLSKMMGEDNTHQDSEDGHNTGAYQGGRLALVAALGMGIRAGGIFTREEVALLQRRAIGGSGPALEALRAMQAKRPLDRTKTLGVLLWRIKYFDDTGPEVFMCAAHLLAEELRRTQATRAKLGPRYIEVMQVALTEWLHDRCGPCKGTGRAGREKARAGRNHPALYTCMECGGTGAYEPGSQQRAQALKMDVETFVKKWEQRYDRVLARLKKIDRTTGGAIDRQVRHSYADATDRSHEQ